MSHPSTPWRATELALLHPNRRRVIEALSELGTATPTTIALATSTSYETTKRLMARMARDGLLATDRGRYGFPANPPPIKRAKSGPQAAAATDGHVPQDRPHIRRHLADKRLHGCANSTITQRTFHLRRLRSGINEIAGRTISLFEVTEDQLMDWHRHFLSEMGVQTRASAVSHARDFYRWAALEQLCDPRLHLRLVRPRLPRRLPRPMPEKHVSKALVAPPARLRPWLFLGLYAGLRCIEIARLRGEDFLGEAVLVRGKGDRERIVPLSEEVQILLAECGLPDAGWAFPAMDRHGQTMTWPVSEGQVSHLTARWLHSIGIPGTMHSLRHRAATDWYMDSKDIRLVQELLGHASITTTTIYTAFDATRGASVLSSVAKRRAMGVLRDAI